MKRYFFLLLLATGLLSLLNGCFFSRQDGDGETVSGIDTQKTKDSFCFLFFSDLQSDPETGDYSIAGELMADAVELSEDPKLVILGGDTVNKGSDEDEWKSFWQAAAESLDGLTVAAVAGNHDNDRLLSTQFDYPAVAPSGQGGGFFYSFDMGNVHFIMLDSNTMGAANRSDIDWLESDLKSDESKNASWRVAVMHHPMWPVTANPKDGRRAETMREFFLPVLEDNGIDLILCGHQHMFSRSLPMSGDEASKDGTGIVQIMASSGGKDSYQVQETVSLETVADSPNYLRIIAEDNIMTIIAYDGNNNRIDKLILSN